ncbi:uncharacterized protein BO66DRAFT_437299 [Aspergillus aculeatinus CBS 121060]|uniref:Uncharacterized protein n=1 Tax=Aspergillus aculeatinus CBS 121060 TaxID=1448322 RepID=A0ACD1HCK8_9EURO|nr:hypothetical protein BO66DRAFT_437299 [Aspergillus aculeatinus CBS 121060]RAH71278.1 hypothetical protein BO66DRAFT_437299 [Aspergillus aculeatinus CBS 121060]
MAGADTGSLQEDVSQVLNVLLNANLIAVDEQVMELLAPNPYALQILLERYPNVPITHRAAVHAAGNSKAFSILLDGRAPDISISQDVILSIIKSQDALDNLQRILKHFGTEAPITDRALKGAAHKPGAFKIVLRAECGNVALSEEVVVFVTYRNFEALQWLLKEHSSAVPLTKRVLVAAAASALFGVQSSAKNDLSMPVRIGFPKLYGSLAITSVTSTREKILPWTLPGFGG